ncbi:MAG: glycosyltransferase family 39 protein [Opitutae bacterium]|nr:glycosyltransferase family 39 protein [Opitutae bacterium]
MKHWRFFFAAALIAATWLLRAPGLDKKIWNVDEAVTFTMAQQILAGDVPYRDAVDQRNPLAPYAQAVVAAVTGDWNLYAQHTVLALMIGLTAVLLWRTARRFGDEATGVAGALWFIVLALMLPSVRDTMPAHTAWYLVFFSTAGFWALAAAWNSGRPAWAAAAGMSFGLSVLAKQPGVLDFGVALVLGALGAWARPDRRKETVRLGLALLAGFAAPLLATGIYFAAKGAWADLVYYTWTYNNALYVPEVPWLKRWSMAQVPFALAWEYHPAVVVLGVTAAVVLLLRAARILFRRPADFDLPAWLILGWCASGLISTTLSGRNFTHYSIQLIPGLSLACGWVSARIWDAGRSWAGGKALRLALAFAAAAGLSAWLLAPIPARIRAFDLPEPGSDTVAELIRRHTGPRERIFVWGYTPEVYAMSERLPATRFLYNTFVTGLIPWTNLDPLKNTDYAIVPGARDSFLADWKAHPPVLVADGRSQRGFMKYPLDKQAWLWPLIERDYARVETAATEPIGFWLFRRMETVPPAPAPAGLPVSGEVQLRVASAQAGETAQLAVQTPAGIAGVELYRDGVLYRRLNCAALAPVSVVFFLPAADWSDRVRRLQAVALGPQGTRLASAALELQATRPSAIIGGPTLDFDGQIVAALESSTLNGGPMLLKPDNPGHWDAHPPSRIVYPWLPGMSSLAFAYGIEEPALAREPPNHTDGVEVVVQVEDAAGKVSTVYRYHFDRELARRARGQTVGYTPLPKGGPGRIILQMTPGPDVNAAYDWSYWLWLRASRSPLALLAGGKTFFPLRLESQSEPRQTEFNGRFITVAAAPSVIEFATTPDMDELSGGFGLHDTAWFRQEKTTPVDFVISLVKPDGTEARVLERTLDPAHRAADRGTQSFQFRLPQPVAGRLRFSAHPRARLDNAHAYWTGLNINLLRTALGFRGGQIPAHPDTEGRFGFLNSSEDGRDCVVAHAPASLVYEWREGMNRLTAEYGLISAAYTKNETEGVVFVVEARASDGTARELFRRHLAPMTRPEDRGAQKLSVAIPPLPGGRLILRTLPPASGNLNAAWSYWRDLLAEP